MLDQEMTEIPFQLSQKKIRSFVHEIIHSAMCTCTSLSFFFLKKIMHIPLKWAQTNTQSYIWASLN